MVKGKWLVQWDTQPPKPKERSAQCLGCWLLCPGVVPRAEPSQANSCLLVPSQQMGLLLYQPIADRVLRVPLGEPTFFSKCSTWNAQHFNWSFQQGILFSISCPLTQLPILCKFQREPLTHFHLKKGHPAFNFFHQVQGDCFLPNFWLQPN